MDAEIEASENPDMKLIRQATFEIEKSYGTPTDAELEARLASITGQKNEKSSANKFKKRKILVSVIAASLALTMIIAVAATPALRSFLSFPFTRNSLRLTEVPEGYVGIYTADDFDLIRENPAGNFILMADIDLGGASHTPIGDHLTPFDGRFNGNGHVISNFTITASGAAIRETVSGDEMNQRYNAAKKKLEDGEGIIDPYKLPAYAIYGIDGGFDRFYLNAIKEEYETQYISAVGFFGNAGNATVIGLGVENATVTVKDSDYTAAGIIAGQVGYISSCYVKDSTLTVNANTAAVEAVCESSGLDTFGIFDYMDMGKKIECYSISAGLLCGEAFAIDSCYTSGTLNATDNGSTKVDYSTVSAGMIVGYASSAVSSYSTANVNMDGNAFRSEGIIGKKRLVPAFIYLSAFNSLLNDCMEGGYLDLSNASDRNDPGISLAKKKFAAYFVYDMDNELLNDPKYFNRSDLEEVYFVNGMGTDTNENFCHISQLTTRYEMLYFQHVIDELGDLSAIEELYRKEGMRVGAICCYTPEGKQNAKYFDGFDFSNVWVMRNGTPEIRIFQ